MYFKPLGFANGNLTAGVSQDAAKPQRALSQATAENLARGAVRNTGCQAGPGFRAELGSFLIRPHVILRFGQAEGTVPALSNNPDMEEVNT